VRKFGRLLSNFSALRVPSVPAYMEHAALINVILCLSAPTKQSAGQRLRIIECLNQHQVALLFLAHVLSLFGKKPFGMIPSYRLKQAPIKRPLKLGQTSLNVFSAS